MPTQYEVQIMKEWGKWEPYFTTDIEQAAECVAGYKSTGNVHVRILEMTFSNGRLKEIIEYKVNPPIARITDYLQGAPKRF
jgi:hypothetical protein